jgi:hypothetical protein
MLLILPPYMVSVWLFSCQQAFRAATIKLFTLGYLGVVFPTAS